VAEVPIQAPRAPTDPKARQARAARAVRRRLEAETAATPQRERLRRHGRSAPHGVRRARQDGLLRSGLPTSQAYRTVLGLWRGDRDSFTYLKTIVSLVPHGGAVARTIVEAIEYTEKARQIGGTVVAAVKAAKNGSLDAIAAEAKARVVGQATAQAKGVVLNTASRLALERAEKQPSFFKDHAEVAKVTDLLAQTDLVTKVIPGL
jgi:hypothetical protein